MAAPSGKWERPRLTTRRLVIEPLRPRHAEAVYEAIDESRQTLRRWLPFAATDNDVEKTRAFIRRTRRMPSAVAWGIWEREAPGRLYCGTIGMHQISLDQRVGTIGYWIRTACAGRGYGTEAGAAVLLWAFGQLGLARVAVEVATGNAPSLRVVRKLGFVREGRLRQAQSIPGRRGRYDWIIASLIRRDLPRIRPRLRKYCGTPRPWDP